MKFTSLSSIILGAVSVTLAAGEVALTSTTTAVESSSASSSAVEQQEPRMLTNYDYPVYKPPQHPPKCDSSPYCYGGYNCCPIYKPEPNCYEVCYSSTSSGGGSYGGKGGKGGKGG
eukprot:CAMPEP_0170993472 /NCGR_PEP_ID=MMETSP0736-20130129/10347_1 /TAXON_ID=186038 /ORGANISM="Fragilariopsis kerguelensis, Strain L26-C5" /LENGTH=115 /DNA_ID=CAMNT_0011419103 /DNA_START=72 /DNA_END=416 /DNA_ORIENTATION=+